ncbi:phage holin [Niallia circulans]|uniref:Phage holin n=1 Tax=Niallia circulans TaxID=1397 RepID=A0A553SIZ2_NIACI|nr:phage holin [Niallia circulans]TRZ36957.1 phage holin [Niallia circulans]
MDRGTLIRTLVLAIALVNQVLVSVGLYEIPGTSEDWTNILTNAFTAISAVVAWFKNNYVTAKGKMQKDVLKANNLTKAK